MKSKEELVKINEMADGIIKSGEKKELNEENIFKFVKGNNVYQDRWIELDCKIAAITECMQQMKKSYEDKAITLQQLLDITNNLSRKEFICIYKKVIVEGKYKSAPVV